MTKFFYLLSFLPEKEVHQGLSSQGSQGADGPLPEQGSPQRVGLKVQAVQLPGVNALK